MIYPHKLKKGDEIRIIAPSRSMSIISNEVINQAKQTLENMGFIITFGKNVFETDNDYNCATIKSRVEDLHQAFLDSKVKCILTAIGGYNVNQLLDYIDYDIIKSNPKILCGFSDITALSMAIFQMTNLVTFSGPHFSTFGMIKGLEYTQEYFKKALCEGNNVISISDSEYYSDDPWYINQENRIFIKNDKTKVINDGVASGLIIGGNLCTFNLLQGTKYFPENNHDYILFVEDDALLNQSFLEEFDRNLESLLSTSLIESIKGIVIGRAQNSCNMNFEKWNKMLKNKEKIKNLPIIINSNFGHTTPIYTYQIGGYCFLNTRKSEKIMFINELNNFNKIEKDNNIKTIYNDICLKEKISGRATHDLSHIKRVVNMIEYLLKRLNYSKEIIEDAKVAAYVHDVGCLNGKENHAQKSYEYFKKYIKRNDIYLFNEGQVLDAIRNHSNGYDSQNIITLALILADKLDISKKRITGIGNEIIGLRQLSNIHGVKTSLNNKWLKVSLNVSEQFDLKEFLKFYFTEKIFKSIRAFANFNNLKYKFLINDKEINIDD